MLLKGLKNGDTFTGYVACRKSTIGVASNGKQYCDLDLFGGETEIMGKVWDHKGEAPKEDTILKVRGVKGEWNGKAQLTISEWRQTNSIDEVSMDQFLPVSKFDRNGMYEQVLGYIELNNDKDFYTILRTIYTAYRDMILRAPAAAGHHHAYLGGYLEHTIGVYLASENIADAYEPVNRDLLSAGALLHDIGKLICYEYSGCSIRYSERGKFLDHIPLGMLLVHTIVHQFNLQIPERKYYLLQHLIASHHGKLEWGSPIEPVCKEAYILHQADMIDSQIVPMTDLQEKNPDKEWVAQYKGRKEFYVRTDKISL